MRISDWSADVCSSDLLCIIISLLIVDGRHIQLRPVRRLLGQPQPIGLEPPFQHPFRLIFLGRNETDSIFVQAFGRKILLDVAGPAKFIFGGPRSEEHTSELQSLMRISYAVFCLKKK